MDTVFSSDNQQAMIIVAYRMAPPDKPYALSIFTPTIQFSPVDETGQLFLDKKSKKKGDEDRLYRETFDAGKIKVKKGELPPQHYIFYSFFVSPGHYIVEAAGTTSLILGTAQFNIEPGKVNYLGHYDVSQPPSKMLQQDLAITVLKCSFYCNPTPKKVSAKLTNDIGAAKNYMEKYSNIKSEIIFPLIKSDITFPSRFSGTINKLDVSGLFSATPSEDDAATEVLSEQQDYDPETNTLKANELHSDH